MISMLTGMLLATASGLNAYIPLLALGLLARFTHIIELPQSWSWLTSDWALITVGVLLVIELIVDKVPALDTVNDVLQTLVRPASGGMVFSAGIDSATVSVDDTEAFTDMSTVWSLVIGIVIALIPHLLKAFSRPILNTVSAGAAAPVVSAAEDTGALGLTLFAIIAPIVGLLFLVAMIWFSVRRIRKARLSRREPGLS